MSNFAPPALFVAPELTEKQQALLWLNRVLQELDQKPVAEQALVPGCLHRLLGVKVYRHVEPGRCFAIIPVEKVRLKDAMFEAGCGLILPFRMDRWKSEPSEATHFDIWLRPFLWEWCGA